MILWLAVLASAAAAPAQDFSAHWHDGRAEMDGYRLTVSRYGQERSGHAVMIFVTEPFSESKWVKLDDHRRNPEDVVDVLKLNMVRDFQTGIYDYNTMVSVFSRTSDFQPLKITFTSAEWCGHVYSELLFEDDELVDREFSYFEGESGVRRLPLSGVTVSEDNLFILLRGLRGAYLQPGQSRTVAYIPGVFFSRLSHRPLEPTRAVIARRAAPVNVSVPAGDFSTMVYEVEAGDRRGVFYIENDWPHRIVRWEMAPDVRGELTGSKRLRYWELNREGDERYLREIGIPAAGDSG
jgi:hypothetical protein